MGQPIQGMEFDRTFEAAEVMVPFKCDVHGLDERLRRRAGSPLLRGDRRRREFRYQRAPPGDYVVEAWHEELGTQTQNVTVGEGGTAEVSFTFTVG